MQSHNDNPDHLSKETRELFKALQPKAEKMRVAGESEIASGKSGEEALESWKHGKAHVEKYNDDEHGVIRVSVGGCPDFVYCNFRGNRSQAIAAVRVALAGLCNRPKR